MRLVLGAAIAALLVAAGPGSDAATTAAGRIAFSLDRDGISRIYSIRPDGTGLRLMTRPTLPQALGGDSGPDWSPNGRRLVFERDLPYWGQDRISLYVVGAAGGRGRDLTAGPFDVMPTWSPDGRRIAFAHVSVAKSTASLVELDTLDGSLRSLTADAVDLTPAWSPDGGTIAFARFPGTEANGADAQLFLVDAAGASARPIATSPINGVAPAWSPDGERIAFVSFRDHNGISCGGDACYPNGEIYVVNADGSGLTRLTTSKADDEHPTWSPDGRRIAFSSGYEFRRDGHPPWLMVISAEGGRARRVGRLSSVYDPAWSPASVR
jgi:Tol biopolymer transport system component